MKVAIFPLALAVALSCQGQLSVTTGQFNNARNGANTFETTLTTANVNTVTFGKLFTRTVDGYLYAEPLYVPNLTIRGIKQNVVFLATMHNSVYAFDADSPTASAPLWQINLGPSVPAPNPATKPEIGILGTPVIDLAGQTLYVVAETLEGSNIVHRLHALDVLSGTEKLGGPVVIAASVPGTGVDSQNGIVTLNSNEIKQRPALLLLNGFVYIAFGASAEDVTPYHGWILGYKATTLAQAFAWTSSPNGDSGGVWQSGRGMAADTNGIYAVTGNGSVGNSGYGNSVLRFSSGPLDYFTTSNWNLLNNHDWDLGTTGPVLMTGTSLLLTAGKQGNVIVLQRANLGHLVPGNTQVVQSLQVTAGCKNSVTSCAELHHPVYWGRTAIDGTMYVWGYMDILKAYKFTSGKFGATPASQNTSIGNYPGGVLALSSNGTAAGSAILWATSPSGNSAQGTVSGTLHAFDATDVSKELWNSNMLPGDALGNFAKYCLPTIVNGKVYVSTFSGQLAVYGLK